MKNSYYDENFLEQLRSLIVEAVHMALQKKTEIHDSNLTEVEAAKWLRVKPQTLSQWRHESRGPEYRKHGGRVVYPLSGLKAFSKANRIKN